MIKNFLYKKTLPIIFFMLFFAPFISRAATLYISPNDATFDVGSNITATVYVSSEDIAMNAASAVISFPTDLLSVVSATKNDSILALKPTFSNQDGTLSFESVLLPPGFTGNAGKLLTVVFKTKAQGTANIIFTSGSVLAADGAGTEILTSSKNAVFEIVKPGKKIEIKTPIPVPIDGGLEAPIIVDYSSRVQDDGGIKVNGKTKYLNVKIILSVEDEGGKISSFIGNSDLKGRFTILSDKLKNGSYKIWVQVGDDTQKSPESVKMNVEVKKIEFIKIRTYSINYRAVFFEIVLFILAVLIVKRTYDYFRRKKDNE